MSYGSQIEQDKWRHYASMVPIPWDGKSLLFIDQHDEYIDDVDTLEEFAAEQGVHPSQLRIYHCKPQYGRELDGSFFEDELPDGEDAPPELQKAIDEFNAAVKDVGVLSYYPDYKQRADVSAFFTESGEAKTFPREAS